ncbi:MAG: hypothetical protein JWP40_4560 [Blastococcus sp.]|nr:hypothetical protein [Blastococcus sp.]
MGKHAAAEGGSRHPLVAAALAQRPAESAGAHRDGHTSSEGSSGLGWPGPDPADGAPVGWPGEASDAVGTAPAEEPVAAVRRSWWRLFRPAA